MKEKKEKRKYLMRNRSIIVKNLEIISSSSKIYNLPLNDLYHLDSTDIEILIDAFHLDQKFFDNHYTLKSILKIILGFDRLFQKKSYLEKYSAFFLVRKTFRGRKEVKGWVFLSKVEGILKILHINLRVPLIFLNRREPSKQEYDERKILNDNDHSKLWIIILSSYLKEYDEVIIDAIKLDTQMLRYVEYFEKKYSLKRENIYENENYHNSQKSIGYYLRMESYNAELHVNQYFKNYKSLPFPLKELDGKKSKRYKYIFIDNEVISQLFLKSNKIINNSNIVNLLIKHKHDILTEKIEQYITEQKLHFLLLYKNSKDFLIYPFTFEVELFYSKRILNIKFKDPIIIDDIYNNLKFKSDFEKFEFKTIRSKYFYLFLKLIYNNNIFKQKYISIWINGWSSFYIDYEYKEIIKNKEIVEELTIPTEFKNIKAFYISKRSKKYIKNKSDIFGEVNFFSKLVKKVVSQRYTPFGHHDIICLYDIKNNVIISTKTYKVVTEFIKRKTIEEFSGYYDIDGAPSKIIYVLSIGTKTQYKYQKKGYGSLIMKIFENKLRKENIFWVILYSLPEAYEFWEKQGYKYYGSSSHMIKHHYGPNVNSEKIKFERFVLTFKE